MSEGMHYKLGYNEQELIARTSFHNGKQCMLDKVVNWLKELGITDAFIEAFRKEMEKE